MPHRWVPVALDLAGGRVVCVGGGAVAGRKLAAFEGSGAEVVVVAPEVVADIAARAEGGGLALWPRPYADGDLEGAALALAATSEAAVNAAVVAEARRRGVPCVRVDAEEGDHAGTAALPAGVRRGPLTLSVSTSGTAPALAKAIRAELEAAYDEAYGELAALMGELRADPEVRAALHPLPEAERQRRWRSVVEADTLSLLRGGRPQRAREVASACLCSRSG